MCGCEKHRDEARDCTCICPEHKNFELAYQLAMDRYDEIVRLRNPAPLVVREPEFDRPGGSFASTYVMTLALFLALALLAGYIGWSLHDNLVCPPVTTVTS